MIDRLGLNPIGGFLLLMNLGRGLLFELLKATSTKQARPEAIEQNAPVARIPT